MPLKIYLRGRTYWARGTVTYQGRTISEYVRQSTGSTTISGARQWVEDAEERALTAFLTGVDPATMAHDAPLTFADAVLQYDADPKTAKWLIPIVQEIGADILTKITPRQILELAPRLYPMGSTDTWIRQVVTPVRAVMNAAHERHGGTLAPAIRIRHYSTEERLAQDARRGKNSRVERPYGNFEWILKFRSAADDRIGALALLMFTTGARIGQALAMCPDDIDKKAGKVRIPGAKGGADRTVALHPVVMAALTKLTPRVPRGWDASKPDNLRLFGYASHHGLRKKWDKACRDAGIERLTPHSAGRHAFGQEFRVRRGVDTRAVEKVGGWSKSGGMVDKTYTHAENHDAKIARAFGTTIVQAERATGIKFK